MGVKGKVPIKWMSPESIHDGYYDQKTDVVIYANTCGCTIDRQTYQIL